MAAAPWIVSDELWELFEPLLPKRSGAFGIRVGNGWMTGSRCRGSCLCCTRGSPGSILPSELGIGSGVTCWRRLDEWQPAGVWERLHALLLERLRAAGEIEWSRAVVDSSQAQAKRGSETGPSRVDRGRPGSRQHLLVDAAGIPLPFSVTGGNRNDIAQLIPLLDAVPAVRGRRGKPRRRPESVLADRACDHDKYRRLVRKWHQAGDRTPPNRTWL